MKPLDLKMVPLRIAERASAIPVLILILLGLHCLKPSSSSPSFPALPCRTPIYIQAEGEVRYPGVYAFCTEPRASEVLSKALVPVKNCEPDGLFTTTTLSSGTKVLVTLKGQACKVNLGEMCAHYKVSLGIPLSLNKESLEGLTAIPGIGIKLAGAIVEEREHRGGFNSMDEIASVRGIGKALYGRIRPYLTL
jgi:competence ComEA-like helix-hairpin-helix protein